MAKVMFLVLEGCSNCKALKNKIGYLNSSFNFYNCDGENELCDQAETLTGANMYPMAIVLNVSNNISEIVYIADSYDKIGKKIPLVEGIVGIPVHSIDQMADYIIKL